MENGSSLKVLMVCLGNICRSPLAEGILRNKVERHGLDWEIDSAGTGSWHTGEGPDRRSVEVAGRYGIDISSQRARQIRPSDLKYYDLILAMDQSNYQDILRLASTREEREKIHMILNFVRPGANQPVPDPYWDDDGFENVYRLLDEACERIIKKFAL